MFSPSLFFFFNEPRFFFSSCPFFCPPDHRLHDAARHWLFVWTAQSVLTRRRRKPTGLHLSLWYVFVQSVDWHLTPSHQVRNRSPSPESKRCCFPSKLKTDLWFAVLTSSLMWKLSRCSWLHRSLKLLCLSFSLLWVFFPLGFFCTKDFTEILRWHFCLKSHKFEAKSRCCPVFQVFPPALNDLPPPMLDLFDLDETFSSEKVRLAQLTNKCKFRIANGASKHALQPSRYHLMDAYVRTYMSRAVRFHIKLTFICYLSRIRLMMCDKLMWEAWWLFSQQFSSHPVSHIGWSGVPLYVGLHSSFSSCITY